MSCGVKYSEVPNKSVTFLILFVIFFTQIRRQMSMKNPFWAGLGSRAVLVKKKFGADYEQLFFMFSWTKNKLDFF